MDSREFFGLTKNKNQKLHHAHLIVGDKKLADELLSDLFEKVLEIEIVGNPDVRRFDVDTYTIDEARELKSAHFVKSLGDKSFFIVNFNSIGTEAQQSLLKVFEDPVDDTHFFVITPTLRGLLPTLLSRFSIFHLPVSAPETSQAEKFIKARPANRIKQIKSIVDSKDKNKALAFVNELEVAYNKLFHSQIKSGNRESVEFLKEIVAVRGFLQTRSPSVKILLEHLSLILK